MPIYRVIKRVVSHQISLIEADNIQDAEDLQGDELTIKSEEEDVEVVCAMKADKEDKLEYRKHYPKK